MSEETTPKTGVSRRTVAKSAAWTIPVIATAVAAPMAAASGKLYISVGQTPASTSVGCLSTAPTVKITKDSLAGAGVANPVTFTITSGNAVFSDGTTSYNTTSDGSTGIATGLKVKPTASGTVNIRASSAGTEAPGYVDLTFTATNSTGVLKYWDSGTITNVANAPVNPDVIGPNAVLSGTTLYTSDTSASVIATGVTSASAPQRGGPPKLVTYVNGTGGHRWSALAGYFDFPAIPVGSKVVSSPAGGVDWFLSPTGALYGGIGAGSPYIVATGVTDAAFYGADGTFLQNGVLKHYLNGTITTVGSAPANPVIVGADYVLSGTTLYFTDSTTSTQIATGVTSVSSQRSNFASYVDGSGGHIVALTQHTQDYAAVPAGSTAVGGFWFLSPTGDLHRGITSTTTTVIATGVTDAAAGAAATDSATFVQGGVC